MQDSYLITNKEVVENKLLDELIISDDYTARFDFTEQVHLMRHFIHSAIVDTEFSLREKLTNCMERIKKKRIPFCGHAANQAMIGKVITIDPHGCNNRIFLA